VPSAVAMNAANVAYVNGSSFETACSLSGCVPATHHVNDCNISATGGSGSGEKHVFEARQRHVPAIRCHSSI
jgi:hypothetical protein